MKNIALIILTITSIVLLFVIGKNQREIAFEISKMQDKTEVVEKVEGYDEKKLDSMKLDILRDNNDTTTILTITKSVDGLYHLSTQYYEIFSLNETQLDSALILLSETKASN